MFLQPGTIQIFGHALNDRSVASQKLDCHAHTTVITYRDTEAGLQWCHINTKCYSISIQFQKNYFVLVNQGAMLSIQNVS